MATRTDRLLREIEAGALDDETPIVDLLRKAISVGGQTGSDALRDWAAHELQGYGDADLPHYRRISGRLMVETSTATGKVSRPISNLLLPRSARKALADYVQLSQSIAEIKRTARSKDSTGCVQLEPSNVQDIIYKAQNSLDSILWKNLKRIYWNVPADTLEDVVEHVRTALTVLVAEIRANTPDHTVTPPAEVATNAVNFAVTGSRNTIHFAAQDGSTVAVTQPDESGRNWVRISGAVFIGLVTIAAAVFALMQAQGWKFG